MHFKFLPVTLYTHYLSIVYPTRVTAFYDTVITTCVERIIYYLPRSRTTVVYYTMYRKIVVLFFTRLKKNRYQVDDLCFSQFFSRKYRKTLWYILFLFNDTPNSNIMIFILHEKYVLRKSKTHNINSYTIGHYIYDVCVGKKL
jgi:hypothetical protein